jgi:hypothetical protein
MLSDLILNIIYAVVGGFANLMPDVSLSDNVAASIATASSYLSGLNNFLPITTLFAIMGLVLTIEGAILGIKIVNWFIRKIPTIN